MGIYNYDVLCHHGIKGQKWGIRRFQNEDGTLTAEGEKRYSSNKDTERFSKVAAEYGNAYADYLNSSKKRYFLENDGKQSFREDGSPRGMLIYDTRKYNTWQKEAQNYLKQKRILEKKYSEVTSNIELSDSGKSYISIKLKDKLGNTYMSDLETQYENVNFNHSEYANLFDNKK